MTTDTTKKKTMPASDAAVHTTTAKTTASRSTVKRGPRDRRVTGYTRIKSGEHKRRSVTRTPDMSNPNGRVMNPNVSLGSMPAKVE